MKIDAIVDLQYGSTGKGLIAGYLSQKNDYDIVVSANMPNAGHTFVEEDGTKRIHKVLPSGVYSKGLRIIGIGPGAVFSIERLHQEVRGLRDAGITAKVVIHEGAAILNEEHARMERENLSGISSTMQGSMYAMVEKMQRSRSRTNVAAFDMESVWGSDDLNIEVVDAAEWVEIMYHANHILCEGSQGYSLGINAGFYPYCTSRDCTVWRLLADCALPVGGELKVIGTARVHPIRVGSLPGTTSGGCYPDQKELSWEDIDQKPELTTVTGRERRVFSFSYMQIREAMIANRVDEVFLNFCNYAPRTAIQIANRVDEIGFEMMNKRYSRDGFSSFTKEYAPRIVKYMGWGPAADGVMEVTK